ALPARASALVGRYVEVQVFIDQRYLFISHVVTTKVKLERRQLAVERPTVIQALQRRRFWRANLAPSSSARITQSVRGKSVVIDPALLNISAEGIACRLPPKLANGIQVDDTCDISFTLPHTALPFNFAAVVRNVTPASDDATIVGLQFEFSSD